MTAHASARLIRTFTRAELAAALAAVDRPDIADGLYARRVEHHDARHAGPRCLALDYDTPGDLAILVVAVSRILSPDEAVEFAAATGHCLPGHPSEVGPYGARWLRWDLDEPTPGQIADARRALTVVT